MQAHLSKCRLGMIDELHTIINIFLNRNLVGDSLRSVIHNSKYFLLLATQSIVALIRFASFSGISSSDDHMIVFFCAISK